MPGKRNLARERTAHDSDAKFREFHQLLLAQVPSYDRAIIGRRNILATLDGYGIKRLNGNKLTWRIVKNWRIRHGLPLLAGTKELGRYSTPAFTTQHALAAWLLARFGYHRLFRVIFAPTPAKREASHRLSRGVRSAPPRTFVA
jgi:hypothetical protein